MPEANWVAWLYYTTDSAPGEGLLFGSLDAAQKHHEQHNGFTPWEYHRFWSIYWCPEHYHRIKEMEIR